VQKDSVSPRRRSLAPARRVLRTCSGIPAVSGGPKLTLRAGWLGQEIERLGSELIAHPLNRSQREVPLTPLNTSDESAMEIQDLGQLLLGQATVESDAPHVGPEHALQLALHPPNFAACYSSIYRLISSDAESLVADLTSLRGEPSALTPPPRLVSA
jgi:hypothetical protein